MRPRKLGFYVLGASLAMLLHNFARRRNLATERPLTPREVGGDVIDLAAWKEARNRNPLGLAVK